MNSIGSRRDERYRVVSPLRRIRTRSFPRRTGRLVHLGPNLEHAVNVRHIGLRRHPLRPCGVHPRVIRRHYGRGH